MWRTVRPPHSEHAAAAPGSQCSVGQSPSPIWIQPPTEAHPPPHLPRPDLEQAVRGGAPGARAAQWARPCARGADLRHGSASQHLAFWPFDGPEGLRSSGSARPPRAPDASGTPRPGSGLSLAWPIRAPPARRATARRRDRRRGPSGLTPAWPGSRCVLASPGARSRRSRRPARAPPDPIACTAARTRAALSAPLSPFTRAVLPLWQMRAQGRRATRRAPAGGAPSCCNGRSWPAERSLGGRATADGPPCAAAARTLGSLHRVRLERLCVC